jgi:hypothetical protein
VLLLSLALQSCSWYRGVGPARFSEYMTPKVKKQAAFDLNCPESQLSVVQLNPTTFGVTGCDRRMSYVPTSNVCSPNQVELNLDQACDGLIASAGSTESPSTSPKQ